MSIRKWMDYKTWHIHTREYYSVIKRNKVLTCYNMDKPWEQRARWKRTHTKGHIFHLYDTTRIGKSEKRTSVCQGRGECEKDFWRVWDFFWSNENALKLDSGDGCTVMQIHEKSLNYLNTLKWWILWYVNYTSIKLYFIYLLRLCWVFTAAEGFL